MNVRSILIALGACLALCALAALAFDWSFQKALILSPIIVLVAGATVFLVVLWGRIVLDSIRGRRERA